MIIRFFCTCGQTLTAPDQYVGQTVRCMTCNELQVVPQEAVSGGLAPGWDTEIEGLGHAPGNWRARLGQAAAVVLLLVGVVGLWWLFFRGDPAASAEYELVPRDALAFFTVKVSDVLKTPAGARAIKLVRKLPESALLIQEQRLGLKLEEIDRLTAVTYDFEQTSWVILQLVNDCDPERIVGESAFSVENSHHSRKYYTDGEAGLFFINRRTLVVGPEAGIQRCLELPRRQSRGPLAEAIRLASRNEHHVVAGVNGPRLASRLRTESGIVPGALESMRIVDADVVTATASVSDKVNVEARVDFPTADKATRVVEAIPGQLGSARLLLPLLPDPHLGVDSRKLKALAAKTLDQLTPKQDGAVVRFHLSFDTKELLELVGIEDEK